MLNAFKQKFLYTDKAALLLLVLYLFIALNCGKRKPPLPPLEKVPQKVPVSAFQRGNQILLTWTMPARNAPDGSVLKIVRVDIYRLAEPSGTSFSLTEDEFSNRSTIISSPVVNDSDFSLKKLTYADRLEFASQPVRLIYAIRFVNAAGQKAAFSNFITVEPTSRVAERPTLLVADITEEAIRLNWQTPVANVDGTTPANILGYNIYRSISGNDPVKLLNQTPISEPEFADRTFEFGQNYRYFVRSVSLGTDGETVESLDSNFSEVSPVDIFPPSPPGAVTIAAAPNNLSIFFATNPEKDIAGYRIYRSKDRSLPLSDWQTLTPELLQTNTFQDKKVESGQVYFYYLRAFDKTGNASEPSEIVFETAP